MVAMVAMEAMEAMEAMVIWGNYAEGVKQPSPW